MIQYDPGSRGLRRSEYPVSYRIEPTMNAVLFNHGDVVIHCSRPEWGSGVVKNACRTHYNGAIAQRLTIDFSNHGRVVINTAIAAIRLKEEQRNKHMINSTTSSSETNSGWLATLEQSSDMDRRQELSELPDELVDPFKTPIARLKATIQNYRFSAEPRSLIDWAVARTGLVDPLAQYTRHDLEQAFTRYARNREQYLFSLVRQIKRDGHMDKLTAVVNEVQKPEVRAVIQKAMRS